MKTLLLIDVQTDFLPGGALAVAGGDVIIPVLNALQAEHELIVATQDWHPSGHGSFAAAHPGRRVGETVDLNGLPQMLWPAHCVRGTAGAAFAAGLATDRIEAIFRKGTDAGLDSYSGFFDNGHRQPTGLGGYLRERGVTSLSLCGLATDYCVKFTALDARHAGFDVTLVEAACRGVNATPGDAARALADMAAAGVRIL